MKKVFFLCVFILSVVSFTYSQEIKLKSYPKYYHLIREAKMLSQEGKSHLALQKFDSATSTVRYVHTDNWIWASKEAKKAGDCELALKYTQMAISQGANEKFIDNFNDCPGINNKFRRKLSALKKKHDLRIDLRLQSYLDSLYTEDQRIRTSKDIDKVEVAKVDSSNIAALKQVIRKYGYPDERIVGRETARKIFLVVLHYDKDTNNIIMKDILMNALYDGKITPQNYAWVVDRRLNWGPSKADPYYYQIVTKKFSMLADSEKQEIDNRRYLIGLKPLSEINVTVLPNGGFSITESWTDF